MWLGFLVVTVASIALIGAQPAAAETLAPGGPGAKAAQTGQLQAPPAGAMKLNRRARQALVAGYSNYRYAQVLLQYWSSTRGWVGWKATTANQYGYYGFWVPAGYFYRFYAQTRINHSVYFGPVIGWRNCWQNVGGFSRYVKARSGWRYRNMNTYLRPVAGGGC
jgi:hypothetical protein